MTETHVDPVPPRQASLLDPVDTEIDPTGYLTGDPPPIPGQTSILDDAA